MKRNLFGLVFVFCMVACGAYAQAVDTTVCDVLKNPESFNGKTVRIKGTVVAGFDQFVLNGSDCGQYVNGIWLSYPQGTKAKSGPLAILEIRPAKNFSGKTEAEPAAVTLVKDKSFKQFDSLLAQQHQKGGTCMGCARYNVEATLTGRLDGVKSASLTRADGKITGLGGYGNLNAYPARLVIASVADVVAKEVSYAKSDAITSSDSSASSQSLSHYQSMLTASASDNSTAGYPDDIRVVRKLAASFSAGALADQATKAASVYPKKNEQNGVVLGYSGINEAVAGSRTAGAIDSPDGVLYACAVNKDHLQPDDLPIALIHLGQHVADLRTPPPGNEDAPAQILENNAWVVSTDAAIVASEKYVVLPGGYLMWNTAWPAADQADNMRKALDDFLANEEHLTR